MDPFRQTVANKRLKMCNDSVDILLVGLNLWKFLMRRNVAPVWRGGLSGIFITIFIHVGLMFGVSTGGFLLHLYMFVCKIVA